MKYNNLQRISEVASVRGDIKLLVLTSYLWNARDWPGKRSCQSQPLRLIACISAVVWSNALICGVNVAFIDYFVRLHHDRSLSWPSWKCDITGGNATPWLAAKLENTDMLRKISVVFSPQTWWQRLVSFNLSLLAKISSNVLKLLKRIQSKWDFLFWTSRSLS